MKNYPIDINDETVFWGRTKKNLYWGIKCGGALNDDIKGIYLVKGQYIYKIKKWKNGSANSGPAGWKAKKARRGRI